MTPFDFLKEWRRIRWGATIQVNLIRSVAAGVVWAIIALFVNGPRQEFPWYALPLFAPVMYLFLVPIVLGATNILALVAPSPVKDSFGLGTMILGIVIAAGDPLVFFLHASKRNLVPVEKFSFFNAALVVWVLTPEGLSVLEPTAPELAPSRPLRLKASSNPGTSGSKTPPLLPKSQPTPHRTATPDELRLADELCGRAAEHFENGALAIAKRILDEAIERCPFCALPHSQLVNVLQCEDVANFAIGKRSQTAEQGKRLCDAWQRGAYQTFHHAERAHQLEPDNREYREKLSEVWACIGGALRKCGNLDDAYDAFVNSQAVAPKWGEKGNPTVWDAAAILIDIKRHEADVPVGSGKQDETAQRARVTRFREWADRAKKSGRSDADECSAIADLIEAKLPQTTLASPGPRQTAKISDTPRLPGLSEASSPQKAKLPPLPTMPPVPSHKSPTEAAEAAIEQFVHARAAREQGSEDLLLRLADAADEACFNAVMATSSDDASASLQAAAFEQIDPYIVELSASSDQLRKQKLAGRLMDRGERRLQNHIGSAWIEAGQRFDWVTTLDPTNAYAFYRAGFCIFSLARSEIDSGGDLDSARSALTSAREYLATSSRIAPDDANASELLNATDSLIERCSLQAAGSSCQSLTGPENDAPCPAVEPESAESSSARLPSTTHGTEPTDLHSELSTKLPLAQAPMKRMNRYEWIGYQFERAQASPTTPEKRAALDHILAGMQAEAAAGADSGKCARDSLAAMRKALDVDPENLIAQVEYSRSVLCLGLNMDVEENDPLTRAYDYMTALADAYPNDSQVREVAAIAHNARALFWLTGIASGGFDQIPKETCEEMAYDELTRSCALDYWSDPQQDTFETLLQVTRDGGWEGNFLAWMRKELLPSVPEAEWRPEWKLARAEMNYRLADRVSDTNRDASLGMFMECSALAVQFLKHSPDSPLGNFLAGASLTQLNKLGHVEPYRLKLANLGEKELARKLDAIRSRHL